MQKIDLNLDELEKLAKKQLSVWPTSSRPFKAESKKLHR